MSAPTVAVTGATGGIGRRLVRALSERGHPVVALSRHRPIDPPAGLGWRSLDLLRAGEAASPDVFAGVDVLVHLAATIAGEHPSPQQSEELWQVNVLGTRKVVEAAGSAGVRQVVVASTANFYRDSLAEADENSPIEPSTRTLYLGSKAAQEWTARSLCRTLGLPCAAMRISSVIGMDQNVVDSFARRLAAGEPVTVADGGAFGADFVDAEDVVSGLRLAVEEGLEGVFNLSSGRRSLLVDAARRLAELAGRAEDAVRVLPAGPRPDRGFPAINCDRLRAHGYAPRPLDTSLAEMLGRARGLETCRSGSVA